MPLSILSENPESKNISHYQNPPAFQKYWKAGGFVLIDICESPRAHGVNNQSEIKKQGHKRHKVSK
jgi:hypothetical protein